MRFCSMMIIASMLYGAALAKGDAAPLEPQKLLADVKATFAELKRFSVQCADALETVGSYATRAAEKDAVKDQCRAMMDAGPDSPFAEFYDAINLIEQNLDVIAECCTDELPALKDDIEKILSVQQKFFFYQLN